MGEGERRGGTMWLDVTTLLMHDHRPGGIPRTMARLIEEWRVLGVANLGFCRFAAKRDGFLLVEPGEVRTSLTYPPSPAPPPPSPPPSVPLWKRALKAAIHPFFGRSPDRSQQGLRMVKAGLGEFLKGVFLPPPPPLPPAAPPLLLGRDDIVVRTGADWFSDPHGSIGPLARQLGFRVVTLIYDLIYAKYPRFYGLAMQEQFRGWLRSALTASDLVVCISQNTRLEVERFREQEGLPPRPTEVIRLGEDFAAADAPCRAPEAKGLARSAGFALFVSSMEPRKNHALLYRAWCELTRRDPERTPTLVLVGQESPLLSNLVFQMQNDPAVVPTLAYVPECKDEELRWLYRNCLFTLFPSLDEGWGLPVAESLAHGKYCIASRAASIPEVGGDLIDYHDPEDLGGLLALIERTLDPAFRAAREERIRRLYRPTPWVETARHFLDHIRTHLPARVEEERGEGLPLSAVGGCRP